MVSLEQADPTAEHDASIGRQFLGQVGLIEPYHPHIARLIADYGFRAPIIAGNQTVNFLLEALSLDRVPSQMDVEVRLLKPVFWDDAVEVQGRRAEAGGALTAIRAVNGDGACVATCAVNSVAY